jgi:hypothetical protein
MPNARLTLIFCMAVFATGALGAGTSDVGERPVITTNPGVAAPTSGLGTPVQTMAPVQNTVVLPPDPPSAKPENPDRDGPECHEDSPSPPKICPTNELGVKVCRCP